jgi:hypothetical protein
MMRMKTIHTKPMKHRCFGAAAWVSLVPGSAVSGAGVDGPIKVSLSGRHFIDQKGQP